MHPVNHIGSDQDKETVTVRQCVGDGECYLAMCTDVHTHVQRPTSTEFAHCCCRGFKILREKRKWEGAFFPSKLLNQFLYYIVVIWGERYGAQSPSQS